MKDIMRKHLWPAALVAALAVVGMLAAFVVLTGPQRGTVEAQSLCATASGATLQSLIQSGVCSATGGTPAPTTGGGGGAPSPVAPGQPGATTPATGGGTGSVCDTATGEELRALIQAGVCMATATPAPTVAPTAVPPTNTPAPTAIPNRDDSIVSSSTSASAGVKLTLTIGNVDISVPPTLEPGTRMEAGSSIELYLEDDFKVPDTIPQSSVYFTVTQPRETETNSGGRVYVTDPIEIDTDDHYGGDDDWAIQVFLPDFNTGDDFDGFQGPLKGQQLQLVFLKSAGIVNPSEAGTHSVGYSVLGPNDDANDGPKTQLGTVSTAGKISLSDEDNIRGYELTVTGSGFNNGTSAAVHVLADPDGTLGLATAVAAGGTDEAQACATIVRDGHRAGVATVGSDDKVAVSFEVTVPIFKPGNVNFICMVDGEGRTAGGDVETFKLEPSIRVLPTSANAGDTINVYAQDYPNINAPLVSLKIAGQEVFQAMIPNATGSARVANPNNITVNSGTIGSDGSATATFDLPGSISSSALEGTVRIDAAWGAHETWAVGDRSYKCDVKEESPGVADREICYSEDAKLTVTGSTLRASQGEARSNDTITITGEGFGTGRNVEIDPANITIDGVAVLVDDDSLADGKVEVSNAGQFVATIYLWAAGTGNNPALIPGTHTIRVEDSLSFVGTTVVSIVEPTIAITPDTLGPRDYLTVTGKDWPVDNQDSDADLKNVVVSVENRTYTVIPDATGRFTVEHRVSRNVGIPSTQQVEARYGDGDVVKVTNFEVPAAEIDITPTEGQPGDEISLTVEGMPVYTEVDEITIGGANALGSRTFRTDRDGDVTADGLAIPGLDPGTYSVVMKVGSGGSQTVAIGSITVLTEVVPGAVAMLPGALSELGDNLEAVFYFGNVSKEWSFYDPREEFADLNTLDGMVADQPYWILVGEAVDEVVLNGRTRSLTCSNGDCWNLVVW